MCQDFRLQQGPITQSLFQRRFEKDSAICCQLEPQHLLRKLHGELLLHTASVRLREKGAPTLLRPQRGQRAIPIIIQVVINSATPSM